MSQRKHQEIVAIDGELEKAAKEKLDRLGREQLPHFVGDEPVPAFEARVQEWLSNLPADQVADGGAVATLLVAGAVQKADVNEKFALEALKMHRLKEAAEAEDKAKALQEAAEVEAKAKELLKKQLADFDVAKYLVDSTKEQREFYGKIQNLLTELKAAVEEPMTLDPNILPGLTSLITDMNKLMEGQSSMQHHSLSSIQGLTKQIEGIGWELHASSIHRRCTPHGTNRSGAWLKESLRETLLCSRMALGELVEVTRANHEILQQDHQICQRNCEVNESMLQVLQRMDAREHAREKVEVEMAKKQKEALQAKQEAQEAQKAKDKAAREQLLKDQQEKEAAEVRRLADAKAKKLKELEDAQVEAENARKRARILEEQMSNSGVTPETVTPPMGGMGGHMNPQMGWAPMNPAMGMAPMMPPMMPPVMPQTGAPHMMGPRQMMTPMGPPMPPTQVPSVLTKARPPYRE